MTSSPTSPHFEYQNRLQDRSERVGRHSRRDELLSTARGVLFLLILGIVWAAFQFEAVPFNWLIPPIALFVVLVVYHAQVVRQRQAAQEAVDYYKHALARLNDDWAGHGPAGERYLSPEHPYAGDLDIFGPGSIFQLMCTARTQLGEATLADWLSAPADIETIGRRQRAVEELRHELDLRESLALLDAKVHDDFDQNRLLQWSQEPVQLIAPWRRIVVAVASVLAVGGLIGWLFFGMPISAFILPLMFQVILTFAYRRQITESARTADEAGSGLAILVQVLDVIEGRQFQSPCLQTIRSSLDTEGLPPSRRTAQLHNLISTLNNSLYNQFFMPIGLMLGLPVHLVHAIEKWKAHVGTHIPGWLQAVGEFEALCAISRHAYEHPDDPFPELLEAGPCFDGLQLCHPLIPKRQCVSNDVSLDAEKQLIMISGSNMSGKSTLLRTVGVNTVLALAGAPVRAKSLRISPLMVGTSMRVNDSLASGASLFYAAVSRLKSVVELTSAKLPLLFLLDEILQGTNSHDRQVGAEGIIRGLIEAGAIGLVTTHDLALTEIIDAFGTRAANVHFEDQLVDGKMTFDYKMRPGIVRKSNALELMRMVGLDV
jgi:hypothetical protein